MRTLWSDLLPAHIWRHPSSHHDIWIILINDGLLYFLPVVLGGSAVAAIVGFASALGVDLSVHSQTDWRALVLFGVYFAFVWDFAATFGHYLKHKIQILWEFHKVHHSAEVLTPLTAMRRHPVESIFSAVLTSSLLTVAGIVWVIAFGAPGAMANIGGTALLVYLWRLLGYNIRHSHIWISYGPSWNRFLMSPAHHQLHHSREPKHHDCNFGHIFTCWDRMFGSLYTPVEGEKFEFGIEAEENAKLNTLRALYVRPLAQAAARLTSREEIPARSIAGAGGTER
jgi:sterol desaturase/sphingolipid hydroxylase (fatty acid hydroxylase superfamily)